MATNDPSSRKRDPTWKYATKKSESDPYSFVCNFCHHNTSGGITRAKEHLIGTTRKRKNTKLCRMVPEEVKEEILAYEKGQQSLKQQKNMEFIPDFDDGENMVELDEDDDDELQVVSQKRKGTVAPASRNASNSSRASNSQGVSSAYNLQKKKGPMDAFVTLDPELEVQKDERRKKLKQTSIPEKLNVELRDQAWQHIARWFYQAGIPFNAARSKSFKVMIKSIGLFGPTLPPPSYHHLRVPLLAKEKKYTEGLVESHKSIWATRGCSLMSDGWTDRKERCLFNFLVNSSQGTVFIESIDASAEIKTGERMFELLSNMVDKIGENNIVQVITDNHSSLKAAGRYLELKYPHLYWTPCAAHCLDLMLEDIGKLPKIKRTLQRAMKLTGFIYAHGLVLNMMREFTKKRELLRPAMTRFATSFLTLASIHKQKHNLKKMFVSEKWLNSRWAKEKDPKGREAASIVMMPSFWNNVAFILKATSPLVRVLRLVDSEKKPAMGYIYEAMERAKEAIMTVFHHQEERYKDIFEIIDRRWGDQLHRPLHAAAYYLNPEYFYDNEKIQSDEEVMIGLYNVIERLTRDQETQDKIDRELAIYRNASGLFGINMAIRNRKTKSPGNI